LTSIYSTKTCYKTYDTIRYDTIQIQIQILRLGERDLKPLGSERVSELAKHDDITRKASRARFASEIRDKNGERAGMRIGMKMKIGCVAMK
jgi:hypothetical protein